MANLDFNVQGNDGDSEREELVSMLQLVLLTAASEPSFPAALREELSEACESESISLDALQDLAERVNNELPDITVANMGTSKFSCDDRAEGPGFSVQIPDGWKAMKNHEELGVVRPFVIVPEAVQCDEGTYMTDRILYSNMSGDADEVRLSIALPEYLETACYQNAYDRSGIIGACKPTTLGVWKVESEVPCVIMRVESSSGYEFYLYPLAAATGDFLRASFDNQPANEWEKGLEMMRALAHTVRTFEDARCGILRTLDAACEGPVDANELIEAILYTTNVFMTTKDIRYEAAMDCYRQEAENPNQDDAFIAAMGALAYVEAEAVPYLRKMLDAMDRQKACGLTGEAADMLQKAIVQFSENVIQGEDQVGDDGIDDVREAGLFRETGELKALRQRLADAAC